MEIFLAGATGQMGKVVAEQAEAAGYSIVGGLSHEEAELSFPVHQDVQQVKEEFDVIIDFSTPQVTEALLDLAKKRNVPIVIASTGHSKEAVELIQQAANEVPILFSGNLSLGVNVMQIVVEQLARMLADFDIEIMEKHHRYKKDAPSGTAKMLFDSVNKGREKELYKLEGRSGFSKGRDDQEVGISSIRGGNIVGEHTVIFAGEDEVIEMKHSAFSKKIFANGALKAAHFLLEKEKGRYDMDDVLKETGGERE